jgi:hypothetical protein
MKVYEGARGLDDAIVIVDGKPLPPRHAEPESRRNLRRNRWFEFISSIGESQVRTRAGRSGANRHSGHPTTAISDVDIVASAAKQRSMTTEVLGGM